MIFLTLIEAFKNLTCILNLNLLIVLVKIKKERGKWKR